MKKTSYITLLFLITLLVFPGCTSNKSIDCHQTIVYVPHKEYLGWHMALIIEGNKYRKQFLEFPSSDEFKSKHTKSNGIVSFGDGYMILEHEYAKKEKWYIHEYNKKIYISPLPFNQNNHNPLPDTHMLLVYDPS